MVIPASQLPTVSVIMTTWMPLGPVGESRLISAKKALVSWQRYLVYDGHKHVHVADDGSDISHASRFESFTSSTYGLWTFSYSMQSRRGVGASLNAGIHSDHLVFMHMQDDWELLSQFDITPWVQLLLSDSSVGMVRLGPPHPWLTGRVEMWPDGWGLRLDRHHYAFGFRAALYHRRFFDAYGPFDEGESAMECERLYNLRFCDYPAGPDIVLALPHPWNHVGEAEVGDIRPGSEFTIPLPGLEVVP